MATNSVQEAWLNSAPGKYFNPDGAYGFQCVDVADAYAEAIFGIPWPQCFGGGNAVQHYPKHNGYWDSIPNIDGDLNSVPERGDVIIWRGDGLNPYGHIAVVVDANPYNVTVIQQNGDGSASRPAEVATLGYNQAGTGPCVGWLRPRVKQDAPAAPAPNQRRAGPYTVNQRAEANTSSAIVREIPANSLEVWEGWVRGERVTSGDMSSDVWYRDSVGYANAIFFDPFTTDGLPELKQEIPAGHRRAGGSTINQRSEPRLSAPVVREIPAGSLEVFDAYVRGELVDLGGGIRSDLWYRDSLGYASCLFFDPAPERGDLPFVEAQEATPAKHRRVGGSNVNQRALPSLSAAVVRQIEAGTLEVWDGYVHGESVTADGQTSDIWYRDAAGYASALFFEGDPLAGDLPDLTPAEKPSTAPQTPEQTAPGTITPPAPERPSDRLRGVDISMHQGDIDIPALGADFVIVKATEGVGYTDPKFARNAEATKGMLRGFYHFARPVGPENNPQAEAEWFLSVVSPHLDDRTVLVLDWEAENQHDTAWALRWLEIVRERTGRTPWLYTYLNCVNSYDWTAVRAKFPLWLACYPSTAEQGWGAPGNPPATAGWDVVAWQYTSSGRLPGYGGRLDLNEFYGTAEAWTEKCRSEAQEPAPEAPADPPKPSAPELERAALREALMDFAGWLVDQYLDTKEF